VFDIVYESPDKDGFSTSGWSRDYTGKWMDPRHEMIGIVSVWNVKCVRIVGFQNIIGFSSLLCEYCGGGNTYPSLIGGGGGGGYASLLCGYG
jgi:hypothetical protein